MSKPVRLASFCRLCLSKAEDKVPIFDAEGASLLNLLSLIELDINESTEPDAVCCFECVVTLEGFQQFKEQCHTNDEFLKTVPPADEEEEDDAASCVSSEMSCQFLEDDPIKGDQVEILNGESEPEEGLVLDDSDVVGSPTAKKSKVEKKPLPKPYKRYDSVPRLNLEEIDRKCKEYNVKPYRSVEGPKLEDLQVLKESYPDYFYFEKGPRAQYFKLVFYGERYHLSNFTERYTYWMCVHRKKQRCPAQVCVRNDYGDFERRYEHNHEEIKEKDEKAFTPLQALPELFKICRSRVMQTTARRRKKMLERKLQELEDGPETDEDPERGKTSAGLKRVLQESGVLDGLEEEDEGDSDDWNE